MDVDGMQANRRPSFSNVTLTAQSPLNAGGGLNTVTNSNVERQSNASQAAYTLPKHPNDAGAAAFKVPNIPITTTPLKRRAASEVIDDASQGNKSAHYSDTNSNASAVARRWAANANLVTKHSAAHQISEKSMAAFVSLLRSKANSQLSGIANVARIPTSNSVSHEPSNAYSPIAAASSPEPNNGNSNASLVSAIDQSAVREQAGDSIDYDAMAKELEATMAANPINHETSLISELLHDAVEMNAENFREYLESINASDETIAFLDELRFRKKNAPISECALKLLRLLQDPNHALHAQRMRLFTTVTAYGKNWWKKAAVVKN
jgi:hypothetical protein